MLEGATFVLACVAAFTVGLSKGGLPAIGMLGVPLLALAMSPVKAAALLLPIYVLTDMVGIYLYRKQYSAPNLKILIPAGIVGVGIGWALASRVSDAAVALLIGLLGIGYCLNAWFGRAPPADPRPPSRAKGWGWGMLTGFTSFVSHAGAPPYQIYVLPQRLPKLVFAGTSTILFAVINAAKIVPYMQLRPYSRADLETAAWLLPAAYAGTLVGAWATRRIAERWFFRLVQASLFAVSLKLVFDAL